MDLTFSLEPQWTALQKSLVELRNVGGLTLLNRIDLLMHVEAGAGRRYEFVRKTVKSLSPLDPPEDARAMRALAAEIRAGH